MKYADGDLVHLRTADELARSAWESVNEASTRLRIVHPRHPLFYRANRILRDLEELRADLRREAAK